jgi:hypothetical protein
MKETKIVELVIADDSQELAIDAISLVSAPAIEQDFVFFGKEKNNLTFAKVDEEKRMLVSPALIPNKQIFRYDPNTDSDYYVYFSPETVRKASELYLKHNNHHKATHEHSERVSGVLTVESWIKEGDSDKSKLYGFDLPNGTWFVKMKIENEDLWQEIKSGNLRGLSIEGYFTNKFEQMQNQEPTTEQILSALNELLSKKKVEKFELSIFSKNLAGLKILIKDVAAINSNAELFMVEAEALAAEYGKKVKGMRLMKKEIQDWFKASKGFLDKVDTQAKELGINANDIPDYKEYKSLFQELEKDEDEVFANIKRAENIKKKF